MCFGWDPYTKGIDIILKSLEKVSKEHMDVRLLIVGESGLEKFITENYGSTLPYWLKIVKPLENVGELYGIADFFLSASRGEGFSYSIGEAMVSKLPVISSDIPGVSWIKESDGVFFFKDNDHQDLTAIIEKVLSLPTELIKDKGVINRKFISNSFLLENWTNQMAQVYKTK